MSARQVNAQEAIVSITSKMEAMLSQVQQQYDKSVEILSSLDTVMKSDISSELKKQTSILMSIDSKLNSSGTIGEDKMLNKNLDILSKGLSKLVSAAEKIKPETGEKIKKFLGDITEGLNEMTKKIDEKKAESITAIITTLGKGVLLFGLSMSLYTVLAPTAMIGALLFGLTIRALMFGVGQVKDDTVKSIANIIVLGKGVLLFGLSMSLYTILAIPAIAGALLFGLTIRALMFGVGQVKDDTVKSIANVIVLGRGIVVFGLALSLFAVLAIPAIAGALLLGLTLKTLSFSIKQMGEKEVTRGIANVALGSIAIILLGLTIVAFANTVSVADSLEVILTVGAFAITFYLLGKFANEIFRGALAITAVGLGLSFLSLGLYFFKSIEMTTDDVLILGLTVGGLALVMGVAGKFASNIALGSLAMALAGLSLVIISTGLAIFSATNLTMEDAGILGAVVGGLGVVMGVAGLASPFIFAGSAAMGVAGLALISISTGLATFKAVGFTEDDGKKLEGSLGAVINGFLGGPMPGGILEGIKFAAAAAARAALLFITVPPMILAGVALLSISAGLSAFKKIGFTTSDSANMESAIGGIVGAFSLITDKERQKKMGINVDWLDLIRGVQSLSQAGNTLSSLAKGIQAFANLSVIEYEVVGAGTKDAKLVPKGVTKLSKSDFMAASTNMATVISAIAEPFANIGKLEKGEPSGNPFYDAIFGGGYVSAGISALARSGDTIVSLAKGVQAFASMEYLEYEVVGAGTKNAKIVPKGKIKLGEAQIAAASSNIAKVIAVVADAFAKVGRDEANSEGIFSGGFLSKGVDALSGIGENISAIVDSVIKIATGTFTPMKSVSDGRGGTKLVPGNPIKITDAMLMTAGQTINKVVMVLGRGMADFGAFYDSNEDSIDSAIDTIPSMTEALVEMMEANEKWSKLTDADKGIQSFTNFNQAVMDAFDPEKQSNLPQKAGYMMLFVKGIERLAAPAEQLDKVASNVERIEKAMKNIKSHVNTFDMERLTKTDSLFKSMAILSKNPEAMASRINDTLKNAFEEFGKALTEAIKEAGGGSVQVGGGAPQPTTNAPVAQTTKEKPAEPQPQPQPVPMITPEMIKQAMQTALNSATLTVKPAPNTSWS